MTTHYVEDYEELTGLKIETKVIAAPAEKEAEPATVAQVK